MGGMVGQGLAIRHPELVRGLVLANTTSRYPDDAQAAWAQRIAAVESGGMAAIADTVMERYFNAGFRAGRPERVAQFRALLLRNDPAAYVATCRALAAVNWRDRLREIDCPTLIIAGALDVGTPVAMSEAMLERIPGARMVVLDEASHLSVAEQPALFSQVLREFLAGLLPVAATP
jgi:3-oxoadipate enol-lactonase